jgi:predicted small integral membrane protein
MLFYDMCVVTMSLATCFQCLIALIAKRPGGEKEGRVTELDQIRERRLSIVALTGNNFIRLVWAGR